MQVASGLCHSAFQESWSPSTVFFSRRNALRPLVLSTDIQILFRCTGISDPCWGVCLSLVDLRLLQKEPCIVSDCLNSVNSVNRTGQMIDGGALIQLFSSVLWFNFSPVCFDSTFQHRISMSSLPPVGGISLILLHWDWDWDTTETGFGMLSFNNKLARL